MQFYIHGLQQPVEGNG